MNAGRMAVLEARPGAADVRAGGLSVLERQIWTLARAGFSRVEVSGVEPSWERRLRLPLEVEIAWTPRPADAGAARVSGDFLIRPAFLAEFLRRADAANLADADGLKAVSLSGARQTVRAKAGDLFSLGQKTEPRRIRAWLRGCAVKPQDGFMARHFDRHLSWAVSSLLMETSVTPNMMSLASLAVGLAGALLFLSPERAVELAGAFLVLFHSMIDGCDGELARVRFQESRLGAKLDFWGDNAVHAALFCCLGVELSRMSGAWKPLALALAAILGALGSAAIFFHRKMASRLEPAAGAPESRPGLADFLAGRDFIYLLPPIVFFGWNYLFLQAAAVGAPIFFAAMLCA